MKTVTATKRKIGASQTPHHRTIDLGNGVMFPVNNEQEAGLVKWLIEEAKAGRVSLPTKAPGSTAIPVNNDGIKRKDWWSIYEKSREDRF